MKRGEIYYIKHRNTVGHETAGARPGIIVSNNALNTSSEVVEVVYLTTQPKNELPTHVIIESSGVTSTAICEHIDHVSTLLVGDYCGTLTTEELRALDQALLDSLGLKHAPRDTDLTVLIHANAGNEAAKLNRELEEVRIERDRYLKIIDALLED